jgi:hypothetical protein
MSSRHARWLFGFPPNAVPVPPSEGQQQSAPPSTIEPAPPPRRSSRRHSRTQPPSNPALPPPARTQAPADPMSMRSHSCEAISVALRDRFRFFAPRPRRMTHRVKLPQFSHLSIADNSDRELGGRSKSGGDQSRVNPLSSRIRKIKLEVYPWIS